MPLAEDDASMRAFLRSSTLGDQVVLSLSNGFEALTFIVDGKFDLLVTDKVLPGMDGLAMARSFCLRRKSCS